MLMQQHHAGAENIASAGSVDSTLDRRRWFDEQFSPAIITGSSFAQMNHDRLYAPVLKSFQRTRQSFRIGELVQFANIAMSHVDPRQHRCHGLFPGEDFFGGSDSP